MLGPLTKLLAFVATFSLSARATIADTAEKVAAETPQLSETESLVAGAFIAGVVGISANLIIDWIRRRRQRRDVGRAVALETFGIARRAANSWRHITRNYPNELPIGASPVGQTMVRYQVVYLTQFPADFSRLASDDIALLPVELAERLTRWNKSIVSVNIAIQHMAEKDADRLTKRETAHLHASIAAACSMLSLIVPEALKLADKYDVSKPAYLEETLEEIEAGHRISTPHFGHFG